MRTQSGLYKSPMSSKQRFRQLIRQTWQLAVGVMFGLFGIVYVAWGATYNFYFNNTEQGDNSTATPTLSVSGDGTVTKKASDVAKPEVVSPATESSIANVPAPNLAPPPELVTTSTATAVAVTESNETPRFRHLRFGAGVTAGKNYGPASQSAFKDLGLSASMSLFFNRDIGLTAFGARLPSDTYASNEMSISSDGAHWMVGLEAELMPFHVGFGRFENLLDIGFLAGAQAEYSRRQYAYSTAVPSYSYGPSYDYGTPYGNYGSASYSYGSEWTIRPHVGARVNLNLGDAWGFTANVRFTREYVTGEGALVFKI